MTYAELVQMYFERSNALQWYWTLYVVVIGGMLAFASIRKQPDALTTAIVTVLYLCFAYKNLDAIHDVTQQRYRVLQAMHELSAVGTAEIRSQAAMLDASLVAPSYESATGVRSFHAACDVLAVMGLWTMELRRRRAAKTGGHAAM